MKIVFFSPHAHIFVHAIPEALVIEALKSRGHDVVVVNCDGMLSNYCVSMSSVGVLPDSPVGDKIKTCKVCRERRNLIQKEFELNSILLDQFVQSDEEVYIKKIIQNVDSENFTELNWMEIPIGRYALYEFLLKYKLNSLTLNSEELKRYKVYLFSALKAASAGRRILEEIKPDVVVTYNSLYSVNHVVCALAEQRQIPTYSIHAGGHIKWRLSTMTIFKGVKASVLITRHRAWNELSNKPISSKQVQVVAEHIEELLKATSPWVYSVASKKVSVENLRDFFGINKDRSVLLATLSSADEEFAAKSVDALPDYPEPIFPTVTAWIIALLEYIQKRNDLFLIIRVHPRDFPNKREGVLSKQAIELQKLLVNLPDNVRVNWPQDQISIHDLVKITDVGLNTTSTVGLELGMFGIPVVVYNSYQLLAYPAGINYMAKNQDDYFQKIDSALKDGWSIENAQKTFRWLSYTFERVAIDISDGFKDAPASLPLLPKIYYRLLKRLTKKGYTEKAALIYQLRRRPIPVKNSEMLSVAIEKNLESHLDLFKVGSEEGYTEEDEKSAIRYHYKRMFLAALLGEDHSEALIKKIDHVLLG